MFFKSFIMCLSMFSRIPTPNIWDEKAKKYVILWLPIVGLIIGLIYGSIFYLLNKYLSQYSLILVSFLILIIPIIVTGFIHYDGYMDVVDAINSFRDSDEKIKILKDPHVGSSAVFHIILLVLFHFILIFELNKNIDSTNLLSLSILCGLSLSISRICSGLLLEIFKPIKASQYYENNNDERKFKTFKIIYFLILLIIELLIPLLIDIKISLSLLFEVLVYLIFAIKANYNLKGVNGDVSGYCIVISEVFPLLMYLIFIIFSINI